MRALLKKYERRIFFVLLLIAFISIYFNYRSFYGIDAIFSGEKPHTSYGHITKINNDVRQKSESQVSWKPASLNQDISEGDSIFTGEDSTAEVTFDDGQKISISSNSLVIIHRQDGSALLDIQYGSFLADLSGPNPLMVLNNDGKSSRLKGAGSLVSFEVDQQKKKSITVLRGHLELTGKDGQAKVENQQTVQLDNGGEVSPVTSYKIQLLEPKMDSVLWRQVLEPTTLRWASPPEIKTFKILVSKTRDFKNPIVNREEEALAFLLKDASVQGSINGKLYWQIVNSKNESERSPIYRFSLFVERPLKITSPKPKQVFDRNEVAVRWEKIPSAKEYTVQISTDPKFETLAVEKNSAGQSIEKLPLAIPGAYYVRAKILDPSRPNAPWSDTVAFSVRGDLLVAPALSKSTEYIEIPYLKAKVEAGQKSILNIDSSPVFRWNEVANASSYLVEISDKEDFPENSQKQAVNSTNFFWTTAVPGVFFWRVRALHNAEPGVASQVKKIQVVKRPLPPPLLNEPAQSVAATDTSTKVKLEWQSLQDAKEYEVEFSKDASMKAADKKLTAKGPRMALQLSDHSTMYWRVRGIDLDGDLGLPSKIGSVRATIQRPKVISSDTFVERVPTVEAMKNPPTPISVAWTEVPFAESYEIQVSKVNDFAQARSLSTSDSSVKIIPPDVGPFYWRVVAKGQNGRKISSFSEIQLLKYTRIRALERPIVVRPGNKQIFTVSKYLPRNLAVSWHPVTGAKNYRLEISSKPTFDSIISKTFTTKTNFITIEKMPPGQLYLRIRSEDDTQASLWTVQGFKVQYTNRMPAEIEDSLIDKILDTKKKSSFP